tara:strand:+ start:1924 stop:2121 length:198 start_codon:yes stop_codon:yes gene_type:complete
VDILDDFSKEDRFLEKGQGRKLIKLMGRLSQGSLGLNEYYRELAEFWKENGFPEWYDEIIKRVRD